MLVGGRLAATGVIADRIGRPVPPSGTRSRTSCGCRPTGARSSRSVARHRPLGGPSGHRASSASRPRHPTADDVDRFDGARYTSTEPDELRGTGASAGIARGTARLTLTQADFGAVQAGDIIVCPSSNPSWVPLFAIAGGLITDTGGVLSHAAVVAREFALPAVVGTGDATQKIADGRLVEIDGTSGIVRLL